MATLDRFQGFFKKKASDEPDLTHVSDQEIADILPAALGRWLLDTGWARGTLGRFTRSGRVVRSRARSLRGETEITRA